MTHDPKTTNLDRRDFFKTAGAGLAAATAVMTPREAAIAQELSEKGKLDRIASNTYPLRQLFKSRPGGGRGGGRGAAGGNAPQQPAAGQTPATGQAPAAGAAPAAAQPAAGQAAAGQGQGGGRGQGRGGGPVPGRGMGTLTAEEMKKKYGEITLLDFPQFTKDTFPGVVHMDIWSSLFGDVTDDSMYARPRLRSVDTVGTEVARAARLELRQDRHPHPSHLEQRANRHGGPGRGGAQGRDRRRQALARRRGDHRRQDDAGEQRRAELPAVVDARARRLSEETKRLCRSSRPASSRSRRWPTTAPRKASRSRSRTTGA